MRPGQLPKVLRRVSEWIARPASLPAFVALVAVSLLGLLADYQNRQIFEQHARATVADRLSVIRARVEGNLSRDIQIGRGVVAALATRPTLGEAEFRVLVAHLLATGSDLRLIAAAPDMIIRMVYPLIGNEKVVGLDYTKTPAQRDAVMRSRTNRSARHGRSTRIDTGRGWPCRPFSRGDRSARCPPGFLGHRVSGDRCRPPLRQQRHSRRRLRTRPDHTRTRRQGGGRRNFLRIG